MKCLIAMEWVTYHAHQTERTMLICWGTDCSAAWCWPKTLQRFWHDKMKMTTLMTTDGNMESHDFTSWQDNERYMYIYICRYTGQLKMVTFLRLFCMQKEVKKVAVLFVVSGAAMWPIFSYHVKGLLGAPAASSLLAEPGAKRWWEGECLIIMQSTVRRNLITIWSFVSWIEWILSHILDVCNFPRMICWQFID